MFLTLARACDKRFSADHDTMLSLLIKAFGPWAFTFYQTVFCRIFRREVAKTLSHSSFSDYQPSESASMYDITHKQPRQLSKVYDVI